MTKLAFGISFGSSPVLLGGADVPRFMDLVRKAEDYGAAALGTYDSAFLGGDAYVRATLMALASSRAAVGLRPTNPLTREPQVMASFLASIDALDVVLDPGPRGGRVADVEHRAVAAGDVHESLGE